MRDRERLSIGVAERWRCLSTRQSSVTCHVFLDFSESFIDEWVE